MRLKTTVILILIAAGLSFLNLVNAWQRQVELEKSAYAGLLMPIPLKEVQGFTIDYGDGQNPVVCQRMEKRWQLTSPINDLADRYAVEEVLALVSYGRARPASNLTEAESGFSKDSATLTVYSPDLAAKVIFGKQVPEENSIYVRTEKQPGEIFLLDMDMAAFLKRLPEEFRAMDLFPGKPDKVQTIILGGGSEVKTGGQIELERTAGGWRLRAPGSWQADGEKVENLLQRYSQLRAKQVLAEDLEQKEDFGFKRENSVVLTVITAKDESETIILAPPLAPGGNGAAIVIGRNVIFEVADGLRRAIATASVDSYRQKRLEPLADVEGFGEIQVEVSGTLLRLLRSETLWYGETPRKFPVDLEVLNQLVLEIENLTAISYINDQPETLAAYGLQNPWIRLRIIDLDGKECINLAIGQKAGQNGYYASLAGRSEIFTLSEDFSRLLARPWYVYHARQIAYFTDLKQPFALSIWHQGKDPQGPPSVRYKRLQGHAWQMDLPETLPVDPMALYRGPLSDKGLGDLRAARFVGTAAEGLAKFGLDPPRLRVVVEYALFKEDLSKKTVCDLEIGDPMDNFYYARSRTFADDLIFEVDKALVEMLQADYAEREPAN
ncbi:MAG: DUF4340 domain-containing protein [Planctomycetes bacterium]|nr:DUF4340 domain-containing protein [Planctomycetota bacterium]